VVCFCGEIEALIEGIAGLGELAGRRVRLPKHRHRGRCAALGAGPANLGEGLQHVRNRLRLAVCHARPRVNHPGDPQARAETLPPR
jgi:hypothetical protein